MATNPKAYADLRTMLDSLEMGALRYYLNGQGLSQPQKFKYLQEKLMPLIDDNNAQLVKQLRHIVTGKQ